MALKYVVLHLLVAVSCSIFQEGEGLDNLQAEVSKIYYEVSNH